MDCHCGERERSDARQVQAREDRASNCFETMARQLPKSKSLGMMYDTICMVFDLFMYKFSR